MLNLLFFTTAIYAHSWVHCTDYRGDLANYQESQCFGHIRPLRGNVPEQIKPFGQDYGFDHQAEGGNQCHSTEQQSGAFPMAQYERGQVVTLAWPAKNHAAASCTNQYIPDTKLELFVASGFESSSFTQVINDASWVREPHVNGQIDFKGFQNCPNFCANTDKSLCTGNFRVPDLPDGEYTFQWRWQFNAGGAPYTTCFQAMIGGGSSNNNEQPAPVTTKTPLLEFPKSDHLYCLPHPDTDQQTLSYSSEWACEGDSGMDCNDAPANCRSGERLATWAFSKYYYLYEKEGGTCDFSGHAYLSDRIPYAECVYMFDETEKAATTAPPQTTRPMPNGSGSGSGSGAGNPNGSGQAPPPTPQPSEDPWKDWVCAPKQGMNPQAPAQWACDNGIVDCAAAPAPCQSGEGLATYTFSGYYMKYAALGGSCDFDGYAEMVEVPRMPWCVFGYEGTMPPMTTTTEVPPPPTFPGMGENPDMGGMPATNGIGMPAVDGTNWMDYESSDDDGVDPVVVIILVVIALVLVGICCAVLLYLKARANREAAEPPLIDNRRKKRHHDVDRRERNIV